MKKHYNDFTLKIIVLGLLIVLLSSMSFLSVLATDTKTTDILIDIMAMVDHDVEIPVWIWLTDEDSESKIESLMIDKRPYYTTKSNYDKNYMTESMTSSEYLLQKRSVTREVYNQLNSGISDELLSSEEIVYMSQYSPVIIANLTSERIEQLKESDKVVLIDYYNLQGKVDDNINPSEMYANTTYDTNDVNGVNSIVNSPILDGSGIKIGVIDVGRPIVENNTHLSGISLEHSNTSVNLNTATHSTNVMEIIYSIAPDADYYYTAYFEKDENGANTIISAFPKELEWLISKGVNVINASLNFVQSNITIDTDGDGVYDINYYIGGDARNSYGSAAKYLDILVYNSDVSFVKTAGNEGVTGINSGGMAYNVITVGNYNDMGTVTDYSDDTIANDSSFYNTPGDFQHKPDICAPGTNVTINGKLYGSGTSYAAPQITGIIALMMQKDSNLKTTPDDVKAILTAGVNMDTSHHYVPAYVSADNSYRKFGAGLVSAVNAIKIIDRGDFYSAAMTSSQTEKTYTWEVTADMVGKPLRISMAVMKPYQELHDVVSNNGISDIYGLANLDLYLYYNTTQMKNSTTTKNNVEILEYTPTRTGTYSIKVKKVSAPAVTTYYGLACNY